MVAQQIKGIGNGFQRVVDFVRDNSSHSAHGGETLRLAESVFRFQLGSNVPINLEDCVTS